MNRKKDCFFYTIIRTLPVRFSKHFLEAGRAKTITKSRFAESREIMVRRGPPRSMWVNPCKHFGLIKLRICT